MRNSKRPKLPWPEDRNFNILSIDGGGIKGILPAAFLAGLEQRLPEGSRIADFFDLFAGTSTGGIVTLGLAVGRTARHVLNLYLERGGEIFPPSRFPLLRFLVDGVRRPVFGRKALDRVLKEEFDDIGFWEANTRMCIPAVEGKYGEVHIYKTPHHPDYRKDWRRSVFEVAQATSAAPAFLEAIEQGGYALVDGGLFANDPIMVAIVDALTCFDVPRDKIRVLSLGCLKDSWNLRGVQRLGRGWMAWAANAYDVTGSLQSQNAQGQAGLLIGPENILRVDAPQPTPGIRLDDWCRACAELPPIAEALVAEFEMKALEVFFQEPSMEYQPIYASDGPT